MVEYASPGHLWRIDLTTGTKTAVVSNLEFGVGLVLSADLQYAYVSEQTTGPDKGTGQSASRSAMGCAPSLRRAW